MLKKQEKNSLFELCPIRGVVARFGNKWAILVLMELNDRGTVRFNALGKLIPDISTKMLASTLRTLEADGLVARRVWPEVPPRVEYRLTPMGDSLIPLIRQLTEWAQAHQQAVRAHRRSFERVAGE